MENLIKDCLFANKTIVIPEIGALTVTNETTREVLLLNYLKFDNKELKKIYAEIHHCEMEEAEKTVDEWVHLTKQSIENGEKVAISDLGYLFKNEENEFEFSSTVIEPTSTEASEVITDLSSPEKTKEDTKKEMIVIQSEVEQSFHPEENPQEIISAEDEVEQETFHPVPDTTSEVHETENTTNDSSPKIEEEEVQPVESKSSENVVLPENVAISEEITTNKVVTPQKKRRKDLWFILVVFVCIFGAFSYIFFNDIKRMVFKVIPISTEVKSGDEVPVEKEETVKKDVSQDPVSTQSEEEDIAPEKVQPKEVEAIPSKEPSKEKSQKIVPSNPTISSTQGDFYVIVGAFSENDNAERLKNQLVQKGFPAEIISNGSLQMVSIESFNSREAANDKVKEVGNCWIFKK